jgi:hypothetical protein
MKTHKITISFNGAIGCDERDNEVHRMDGVIWECVTGQPFSVDFGRDLPLTTRPLPGKAKGNIKATIKNDAVIDKHYKYTVALYDSASKSVHMLDPDLIIRR